MRVLSLAPDVKDHKRQKLRMHMLERARQLTQYSPGILNSLFLGYKLSQSHNSLESCRQTASCPACALLPEPPRVMTFMTP
eukprot:6140342-Amphidinium_carterae.3